MNSSGMLSLLYALLNCLGHHGCHVVGFLIHLVESHIESRNEWKMDGMLLGNIINSNTFEVIIDEIWVQIGG